YAINPEAGFFGVAPGTGESTNKSAIDTLNANCIYTNVALTDDGDVWWEGLTDTPPAHLTDWKGRDWTPASDEPAAHPNARFTAPASQCPTVAPEWEDPAGVPIDAILFGGRRASNVPLVTESFDWTHGVFLASNVASEGTAAAENKVGELRRDPFAMLPFCGYNMGDYFGHWLDMGKKLTNPPAIFHVNWFRKDTDGKFLWPGYGQNVRVLMWMLGRIRGSAEARETAIGYIPTTDAIDLDGLKLSPETVEQLFALDKHDWEHEWASQGEFFQQFGDHLPAAMAEEHDALKSRISVMQG
ncbi:MAG TPA: phosphoenolpyruvate carboxykinase domain-containing protein, partial [Ktedonobacterales bacterium]|nr:phosphoenolpyruvate carboxykinase domain-containing protein [Ktedonobacterales bacterium]